MLSHELRYQNIYLVLALAMLALDCSTRDYSHDARLSPTLRQDAVNWHDLVAQQPEKLFLPLSRYIEQPPSTSTWSWSSGHRGLSKPGLDEAFTTSAPDIKLLCFHAQSHSTRRINSAGSP